MNFWTYLIRRLATIPPTIFILLLIIFFVFTIIGHPSPVSSQFPTYSDSFLSFSSAYYTFAANILTGHWGYLGALPKEHTYSGPLNMLVTLYLFSTLDVVLVAAPIAIAISFPLGRYLGTHPSEKKAKILRGMVAVGYLTPAYLVALVLQISLGKNVISGNPLGVFPVTGEFGLSAFPFGLPAWASSNSGILITSPTHMIFLDSLIHLDFTAASNIFMHMVMPVLTLVFSITAIVTFLLESGYIDNMGMEYVRGARAKGVPEKMIVIKHVRRNAVIPVMAATTIMVAYLLSNIIMMEYVFGYPGIGLFLVTTMSHGQYYPTAVIVFLFSLIVISMGIVIDMVHFVKNPLLRT